MTNPRGGARTQDPTDRFWRFVTPGGPDECWEWGGSRYPKGYGSFIFRHEGQREGYAHRAAYLLFTGPIPPGFHVDHKCHNPPCVNPKHLRAVTPQANGQNRKGPNSNSTTGLLGVHFDRATGKYLAHARVDGRFQSLGRFETPEQAHEAATKARQESYEGVTHD